MRHRAAADSRVARRRAATPAATATRTTRRTTASTPTSRATTRIRTSLQRYGRRPARGVRSETGWERLDDVDLSTGRAGVVALLALLVRVGVGLRLGHPRLCLADGRVRRLRLVDRVLNVLRERDAGQVEADALEEVAAEHVLEILGQAFVHRVLHLGDVGVVLRAGRADRRGRGRPGGRVLHQRAAGHELGAAELVDLDTQVVLDHRADDRVEERAPAGLVVVGVAQLAVDAAELAGAELLVEALDAGLVELEREVDGALDAHVDAVAGRRGDHVHAAGVAAGGVRGDRVEALLRRVLVGDRGDAGPGQARPRRDDLADPVVVEGAAVAHHADLAARGLVEAGEERDRGGQQDHRDHEQPADP